MIHLYASFLDERGKKPEHQTGRMLLARGLQELCGIGSDSILLEEGVNGKPYLKQFPDIHFNISHTDGLAVCAFSDRPVGVDVEKVKPVRDPLVRRVLCAEEQEVLYRFRDGVKAENGKEVSLFRDPEQEKRYDTVFFRYWTLKESFLKREGCGLTREPAGIRFALDPEDWEAPVSCPDGRTVCRQQRIRGNGQDLAVYVLSVCAEAGVCFSEQNCRWVVP